MDFKDILKKNLPAKGAEKKAISVVNNINENLTRFGIKAHAVLGGSLGKNTHLKKFDCDVFVIFDNSYEDKPISDILEKIVIKFNPDRVHGSRDYFQFVHNKLNFEIVPVLDVKDPKKVANVTDMSPFHVKWVSKHIKNLNDDVRLAKLFCKGNDIYGAESYINGFSGYILEILVIHYGGFVKLLEAASKWRAKQVVDPEKYYKKNPVKILNESKVHGPMIIIDPVQKERNAAAALKLDKFSKFSLLARLFLENPDDSFFKKVEFSTKEIQKDAKAMDMDSIVLKVKNLPGKQDVVGTKVLRVTNLIKKQIELSEFTVFDFGFQYEEEESTIWFVTYPKKLPKVSVQEGPKIYAPKENFFAFIDKHDEIMLKEDRIFAVNKRKYIEVNKLVKDVIKMDFVKSKVKKISF